MTLTLARLSTAFVAPRILYRQALPAIALSLALSFIACARSNPLADQAAQKVFDTDSSSTEQGVLNSVKPRLPLMCVQVFYDGEKDSAGAATLASGEGRLFADMVVNLLGHFQEVQPIEKPVALYAKGDFDRCAANIYIGSDFYASLSNDFISDFSTTSSRVAWLGYGFWNLGNSLTSIFGVSYQGLIEQDAPTTPGAAPGFYRDVLYKGATFQKYGRFDASSTPVFDCDCEVAKLQITDKTKATVLAKIKHSISGASLPYALRAGKHFLFADLPLTYIYEADRYNVFADVLFDIVNLPARHTQHLATIRLEDIHAFVDLTTLDQAMAIFKKNAVVPTLSMIPLFADPLGRFQATPTSAPIAASTQTTFMQHIHKYKTQGATFIWHGVTHQYGSAANPLDGVSGDDYEFWDAVNNRAWPEDSASFVTDRLSWGQDVLTQMGLHPRIWLTPHYQASAVDNAVFARLFAWNMGRITYFSQSQTDGLLQEGQFYPYEIYHDTYGMKIIPENLGYVSTAAADLRSVSDMLTDAKRNVVLRDSWASAFYHPYLLGGQNASATDLDQLIKGLKKLGYTFVNLDSCLDTNGCLKN